MTLKANLDDLDLRKLSACIVAMPPFVNETASDRSEANMMYVTQLIYLNPGKEATPALK